MASDLGLNCLGLSVPITKVTELGLFLKFLYNVFQLSFFLFFFFLNFCRLHIFLYRKKEFCRVTCTYSSIERKKKKSKVWVKIGLVCRTANRKSQKLSPMQKMAEKLPNVSILYLTVRRKYLGKLFLTSESVNNKKHERIILRRHHVTGR